MLKSEIQYGWRDAMEDEAYFSDKSAVNSSSLKLMLKSPAAFQASFFQGLNPTPTQALKFGKLSHLAILQGSKFRDRYQVMPKFTGYTTKGELTESLNCKEVREKRDAWLAVLPKDAIVCTEEERDDLLGMINSIIKNEKAFKLLQRGSPEIVGFWRDPKTGINCKMKADFISFDLNTLVDIKTITDCSPDAVSRAIENYKYEFQMSHYREGMKQISGKYPDHVVGIFIEKIFPYECAVFEFDPVYLMIGAYDQRYTLDKLNECLAANSFPFRQQAVEIIEPNHWYSKKYENLI